MPVAATPPVVPRRTIALALAVLIGVAGATAVRALGIRPVQVASGSMSPAISRGDSIVVRDLDRDGRRAIAAGDVVMFRFPLGTSGRAIKRVVAAAGDRVTIRRHSVTVNGRRTIRIAGAPSPNAARARVETVPPGNVFLLGDNSTRSIDSRSFGSVPTDEVVARVALVAGGLGKMLVVGLAGFVLLGGAVVATAGRSRRKREMGAAGFEPAASRV